MTVRAIGSLMFLSFVIIPMANGQDSVSPPKATPLFATAKFAGDSNIVIETTRQTIVEENGPYEVERNVTEYVEQAYTVEVERDGRVVTETRVRRVPVTRKVIETRVGPHKETKYLVQSRKFNIDKVNVFQIESELDELLEVDHSEFKRLFDSARPTLVIGHGQKLDPYFYSIVRPGTLLLVVPSSKDNTKQPPIPEVDK